MIGVSAMFADAVGLAPFKDDFWTTAVQPGNPYGKVKTSIDTTVVTEKHTSAILL